MEKNNILPPEEAKKQLEFARQVRQINEEYKKNNNRSRRAFVLTFGCQQNEADSERIAGQAALMGYEIARTPEDADLIIVNTCAIREHAEQKALSIIGQYKHLKAKNPELIIGVCGCMVSQEHRKNDIKFKWARQ